MKQLKHENFDVRRKFNKHHLFFARHAFWENIVGEQMYHTMYLESMKVYNS